MRAILHHDNTTGSVRDLTFRLMCMDECVESLVTINEYTVTGSVLFVRPVEEERTEDLDHEINWDEYVAG
jgi:hypothetical protein